MKTNPLKTGAIAENSRPLGTPTEGMVRQRAAEIAQEDGRSKREIEQTDTNQATAELTGEPENAGGLDALEDIPESERWDPVGGSSGRKKIVPAGEDEDDEGRSDNERLVEEGVAEAEEDHARQAGEALDDR